MIWSILEKLILAAGVFYLFVVACTIFVLPGRK